MQLVYASRTGNVEKLISRLGISALKIESGEEKVSGDYVLVTYTDGAGILPPTVEKFIEENKGGSSSQRKQPASSGYFLQSSRYTCR